MFEVGVCVCVCPNLKLEEKYIITMNVCDPVCVFLCGRA